MTNDKWYKILSHRADIAEFRFETAEKRRAFNAWAIRFDVPALDDEGHPMEDRSLSDRGKGKVAIYTELDRGGYAGCVTLPDGCQVPIPVPKWQVEFERVLNSLEPKDRDIVEALFVDLRPAVAARIAGVSRCRVYRVMAALKEKLAKAHKMWMLHISWVLRLTK